MKDVLVWYRMDGYRLGSLALPLKEENVLITITEFEQRNPNMVITDYKDDSTGHIVEIEHVTKKVATFHKGLSTFYPISHP